MIPVHSSNTSMEDARSRYAARFLVLVGLIALLLPGCNSFNGKNSTYEELGPDANTRGFGRRFPHDPNENAFVFGVGDQVVVKVEEDAPAIFSGGHVIRQDGNITIPLLNDVMAAGLTTNQLRKKLETRIRLYINDPQVTVAPGLVVSRRYYLATTNPGTGGTIIAPRPYIGDVTLFDVFIQMGAPSTILDDETHIRVIRPDPRNPRVMNINIREMYREGLSGGNIQIQPDDIVYVPPTLIGRLNVFTAGISIPFNHFFRLAVQYDRFQMITGDNDYRRGRVFY